MPDMFYELEEIIRERKENPKEGSYTNRLLDLSLNKISQKVGEEAVEVIVAALGQGRKKQIGELADLAYHTLVLMSALNITMEDVSAELRRRHDADTLNLENDNDDNDEADTVISEEVEQSYQADVEAPADADSDADKDETP
jgi:phosphoribosyl-ATP pyrophosphohydrolase